MLTFARTVRRTLELLGPERRWRWIGLVGIALLVTALEALGAALIYALLGLVTTAGEVTLPVIGDLAARFPGVAPRTLEMASAAVVGVFFFIRSAVFIGQAYVQHRVITNAGADLSTHLVRGYLRLPYIEHTKRNSSVLVRNAFDSVQSLIRQVMRPAVEVMAESILVAGLCIVLVVVTPRATLLAVGVLLPTVLLLLRVVQPRLKQLGRESQDSRQGTLEVMQQALGGVRDIRLLRREDAFTESFRRHRRVMARTDYLRSALNEIPRTLIETALVVVIILVFLLTIVSGDSVTTAVSTLGVFAYAGLRMIPSLRKVVSGLNDIRFGSAIIDDLLADREWVAPHIGPAGGTTRLPPGPEATFTRNLELRDVHFRYAPESPPALRGVTLTIRKGEFVGICGPTGGGKSTLVDLMTGLLEPTSGEVLVDGRSLGPDPRWWYAQLGVVSQSVFLIDDSLRRNIVLGARDRDIDEERLARSIRRAQLDDVVARLPDGLDTVLGERGIRLSGGQRQRIAIARALYHEPDVLVFDEGTSALDAATETALVHAVDELKHGRTLISVAHRITTVRDADRILVVDGGRIVAEGPHDDLLRDSALFRALAS